MTFDGPITAGLATPGATLADLQEARADLARLREQLDRLIADADVTIAKWTKRAGGLPRAANDPGSLPLAPLSVPVERPAQLPAPSPAELDAMVAAAVTSSDHLTLIRGIDPATATQLNTLGVCRYADIAAFTDDDIAQVSVLIGNDTNRIARERWISQAARLAQGHRPIKDGAQSEPMEEPATASAIPLITRRTLVSPLSTAAIPRIFRSRSTVVTPKRRKTAASFIAVVAIATAMVALIDLDAVIAFGADTLTTTLQKLDTIAGLF